MEIVFDETYKSEWDIPINAEMKFQETFDMESDTNNFKHEFGFMTKKHGRPFMEYCRASWITCKDFMTVEEFCKMNANMPVGFFRNKIDVF